MKTTPRKLLPAIALAAVAALGLMGWELNAMEHKTDETAMSAEKGRLAVATFAGGCFWCVEAGFEKLPGVVKAISGYTGGHVENPTYEQVSAGGTGHAEAVQVTYDPTVITYYGLLQGLWRMMDPTDHAGQFVDRGSQYRPAIFYHNEEQKRVAEQAVAELKETGPYDKPIVIEITPFEKFYVAEGYHQDYYKTNPIRYKFYTFNSGRYQFVDSVWGEDRNIDYSQFRPKGSGAKMSDAGMTGDAPRWSQPPESRIKELLTPLQYKVTREDGTEPAFDNAYWDNKKAGIYVDILTGEPLFSSTDKYKSGTGWPSFTKPIDQGAVTEHEDRSFFTTRTEIRSAIGDNHLGHVFDDGPAPTGLRYCMNSASMRFVPVEDMAAEGYGDYLHLFADQARN